MFYSTFIFDLVVVLLVIVGGGFSLNSRGGFLHEETFLLVVSSVGKSENCHIVYIEFLNSLHPTLHPPCELHGKE
jgi:hypothetical protein